MQILPDWLPRESWDAFIAMRKKMGKKHEATEYAQTLLIKKLDGMRKDGQDVKAVINESIMNSWVGLYPVKAKLQPEMRNFQGYESAKDRSRREASEQLTGGGYARANRVFDVN